IFGVKFTAEHTAATHPALQGFTIGFDNPYETSQSKLFTTLSIYESTAGTYDNSTDLPLLNGSVTQIATDSAGVGELDAIHVSFATPRSLVSTARSYYLVVNVDQSANLNTPKITPILVDLGYGDVTDNNILTTEGSATTSVTEDGIQTVQALTGQTYQFATTRPPTLVTSNPFNGQLNVDPALTQIDLTFDVSVVSFDGVAELYSRGTDELVATL